MAPLAFVDNDVGRHSGNVINGACCNRCGRVESGRVQSRYIEREPSVNAIVRLLPVYRVLKQSHGIRFHELEYLGGTRDIVVVLLRIHRVNRFVSVKLNRVVRGKYIAVSKS